ncbi:hypothetical protein [Jeotgalibacillus soli]|uniref:STAS domain-containing protein n=1 Tax=Jeotgalibacillus soli TaxID=889306 RepID=A0A0C2VVL9_9BACL|nr:hypothetical protein [Jeotgalibacillus soli]KIL48466.1 hypothetical protein KP78_15490 [Jeotgalibacillus soli]
MLDILDNVNIYQLINKIDENIFIANADQKIVWVNASAKKLLLKVGPHVSITNPDDFIGMNISRFHGERQTKILKEGPFPHAAHITLFEKFSANILVDEIKDIKGKPCGFILTWKDVTEYDETIKEGQDLLQEVDTPIIESIIDSVILVPVMGRMKKDRLESMQKKISTYCSEHQITNLIIDFTSFKYSLAPYEVEGLSNLINILELMGVEVFFVGIGPNMAQSIILKQINFNVVTFNSFKQALKHIMKQNGYKFVKEPAK